MLARINPDRLAADPDFQVLHPESRRSFPSEPFLLSVADWNHPLVRRLFAPADQPGGAPGGVFADLLLLPDDTTEA